MFSVFRRIEDNFSGSILKEMILVIFYKLYIWDNFVSSEKKKQTNICWVLTVCLERTEE